MADFFAKLSDFWNTIMGDIQSVISAFDKNGGGIFSQVNNLIVSLLGKAAESAESLEGKK